MTSRVSPHLLSTASIPPGSSLSSSFSSRMNSEVSSSHGNNYPLALVFPCNHLPLIDLYRLHRSVNETWRIWTNWTSFTTLLSCIVSQHIINRDSGLGALDNLNSVLAPIFLTTLGGFFCCGGIVFLQSTVMPHFLTRVAIRRNPIISDCLLNCSTIIVFKQDILWQLLSHINFSENSCKGDSQLPWNTFISK